MSQNGLMKNRMDKSLLHKLPTESILKLKKSMKDRKLSLNNGQKKFTLNHLRICVTILSMIIAIIYVYIVYS